VLGGARSIGFELRQAYQVSRDALAAAFENVASGVRVSRPSDSFVSYLRAQAATDTVAQYQRIKENLIDVKAVAEKAEAIGEGVYEALRDLKATIGDYNNAESDDERRAIAAEFAALKKSLGELIASGSDVYAAATVASVEVTPGGQSWKMRFDAVASTAALSTTFGAQPTNPAALAQNTVMAAQLSNAGIFLTEAREAVKHVERHIAATEGAIDAQHAVARQIVELDDAEAMADVISSYIRHEAALSMLAQANLSTARLSTLYDAPAAGVEQPSRPPATE
jgi:flagellin-like hook-associated protein FlgL